MVSPSRPYGAIARQFMKQKTSMSKLGILIFIMLLMLTSTSGTDPDHKAKPRSPVSLDNTLEPASNLIKVKLPYSVNSIAAGTIPLGSGFAYIHEETIRFKDPVNLLNDSEPIGIGFVYDHTLKGADIEGDGYTEFLFMKDNRSVN